MNSVYFSSKDIGSIRRRLLTWFRANRRDLPWRRKRTAYCIWISEIMLQQTQVQQVIPYYRRFCKQFPSIKKLANARLDQVLKVWEGMGYYARARHLLQAARMIQKQHAGVFPQDYNAVRRLPGIGPYTAAAILSIAFQQRYAVVDGNVVRVLSRLAAFPGEVQTTGNKKILQTLADTLLPVKGPGDFNEAVMELGALLCTPTAPHCGVCPLARCCRARQQGEPERFPFKRAKKKRPHHEVAAAIIWRQGRILLARRPERGLLGGLWEFPGGKREKGETLEQTAVREVREELGVRVRVRKFFFKVNHQYTHFSVTLNVFHCDWVSGRPRPIGCSGWRWVLPKELERFAFPRANGKIIEALLDSIPRS
ncbi:MAG TPA: A/G-specific adenine glycosylase [bacterium]|nr:A/G-specific adenine glycosylase [bacterium]HPN35939.1 A/G-specific adenine glycosylase [bacterium]